MNVRRASKEDIPRIQELFVQVDGHHHRLLPEVFAQTETDARPDALIAEWIEASDSDYLVAEGEGHIAGFLSIQETSYPDIPLFNPVVFAQIDSLVVDQEMRGGGIGRQLMEAAIGWAKDRGVKSIQANVWNINAEAHRFYADLGFKPVTQKMELEIDSDERAAGADDS